MDYRVQRLKEDLTNAQHRNKNQRKQLANYTTAYDKKCIECNQYKQALNEIRKIITDCKNLMPHEFDWEEQVDNILQIIDKVGGNE